MTIFHFPRS